MFWVTLASLGVWQIHAPARVAVESSTAAEGAHQRWKAVLLKWSRYYRARDAERNAKQERERVERIERRRIPLEEAMRRWHPETMTVCQFVSRGH